MTVVVKLEGTATRPFVATELLRAARPRQWVKNALVFAGPAAAGLLLRPDVMLRCLSVTVALTLTASGCYLVNDVLDRHLDRVHPRKSLRPVAVGTVSVRLALWAAVVSIVLGLALAADSGVAVLVVVGVYAAATLVYGLGLKHVAFLEMVVVASGFVLRTLAGADAARIDASEWFLLVVSAAAGYVVVSKRASELQQSAGAARPVLRFYSRGRLQVLQVLAGLLMVSAYGAWAFFRPTPLTTALALLSLGPVVLTVVRWSWCAERGLAGAPEDLLVHDPWVRTGALVWTAVFAATVVAEVLGA